MNLFLLRLFVLASKRFNILICRQETISKFFDVVFNEQQDRITYQIAAKESLQKLINERVDALNAAAEHQRARTTAEQEVMLSREELEKAQKEIQVILSRFDLVMCHV